MADIPLHSISESIRCLGKSGHRTFTGSGLFFTDCVDKAILIEFSGALVRLTHRSAKATIDELTRRPLLLNYFRFRRA
jgi:hypothetical protein